MGDFVILFTPLIVASLSRKTLLAGVAGSNLIVRRIPFPDVGHGENGRAKISATHNEDQEEEKDK
jgi:hypothetical protein